MAVATIYKEKNVSNPVFSGNVIRRSQMMADSSRMTINGSIMKTFILGLVFTVTIFTVYTYSKTIIDNPNFYTVLKVCPFVALVSGLVISFRPQTAPYLSFVYILAMSVAVAFISILMDKIYEGIVIEAITYTMITFFSMLILFKMEMIKVTAKFKAVVITATSAIFITYLILFVLSFLGIKPDWFYGNSTLSIMINLGIVIIAALNLILDFDFIVKGEENGLPKFMEWYAAFGLMVTIIWLYLEILKLLAKAKSRK